MYAPERQQAILGRARADGRVDVNGLADLFDVTPETIRRDLTSLERRGVLSRVHGGAIPVDRLSMELAVSERFSMNATQKDRIAKAALDQLPDGGGARIDDDGTAVGQLFECGLGDPVLLCGVHAEPLADRQFHAQPINCNGAAVHPAQHAAPLQAGQVPADGLRGDVEHVGEPVDIDTSVGAGEAEDGLLPFRCVHVDSVVVRFVVSARSRGGTSQLYC